MALLSVPSLGDLPFKELTLQFIMGCITQHSMWRKIGHFLGVIIVAGFTVD